MINSSTLHPAGLGELDPGATHPAVAVGQQHDAGAFTHHVGARRPGKPHQHLVAQALGRDPLRLTVDILLRARRPAGSCTRPSNSSPRPCLATPRRAARSSSEARSRATRAAATRRSLAASFTSRSRSMTSSPRSGAPGAGVGSGQKVPIGSLVHPSTWPRGRPFVRRRGAPSPRSGAGGSRPAGSAGRWRRDCGRPVPRCSPAATCRDWVARGGMRHSSGRFASRTRQLPLPAGEPEQRRAGDLPVAHLGLLGPDKAAGVRNGEGHQPVPSGAVGPADRLEAGRAVDPREVQVRRAHGRAQLEQSAGAHALAGDGLEGCPDRGDLRH